MPLPDDLKSKTPEQMEEWFLGAIESNPLPVTNMLTVLADFSEKGDLAQFDSWAELMEDALVEQGAVTDAMSLLVLRASAHNYDNSLRTDLSASAEKIFNDRLGKMLVKNCGFDQKMSVADCLYRLELLSKLKDGVLCYDKTWGFGVVRKMDDFYGKVKIDFNSKPDHQMTFSYAAETLELVGNDHILARKHLDPEGLTELVRNDPAEVVRIVIRSYGPLNAPMLRDKLVDEIMSEDDWKKFWEGARKKLRNDPLVDLPGKRNDPIRLLEKEKEFGNDWFVGFGRECDTERILELIDELDPKQSAELTEEQSRIIAERFRFVIQAEESKRPEMVAVTVMTAKRLKVSAEILDLTEITARLIDPETFKKVTSSIQARNVGPLIQFLSEYSIQKLQETVLSVLGDLETNVLSEVIPFLLENGRQDDVAEIIHGMVAERKAGERVLFWICRNMEQTSGWLKIRIYDLMIQVIDVMDTKLSGNLLKVQHQLRKFLEQRSWMEKMLKRLEHEQREELLRRVNRCKGWDTSGKRSVMAIMIKLYPELEKVLSAADDDSEPGRITSWRSYNERREQLRKLLEEDVPANSKDIAVARSYGDLRENAEYHAAKETQRLLGQKKNDIENDLESVKGSDFDDFPSGKAGPGTIVTVSRPDGSIDVYVVLGEWDRDAELGIISSKCRLAEALEGKGEGAELSLPGESGEELCRIEKIEGLSEEVRKWLSA